MWPAQHEIVIFWNLLIVLLTISSTMARPKVVKSRSSSSLAQNRDPFLCDPDKLMAYRVTLGTHWSRNLFPKQYPEWRPPAQWSKLVGKF